MFVKIRGAYIFIKPKKTKIFKSYYQRVVQLIMREVLHNVNKITDLAWKI